MTKILYITTTIKDEGPGNLLGSLLENIDRTKYQPQVLTIQGTGKWEKRFKELNIPVTNLGLRTPADFLSLPFLYYHIRKIKPDFIHTQLLTADLFGRLAARLARVPYVTTIHNMDDWKRSAKPLSLAAKTMDAYQLKKALEVIAVSQAVKQDTIERQDVDGNKIKVIKNAIDIERFQQKLSDMQKCKLKNNLGIPEQALVVGTSARLSIQKAPEVWLATAKNIIKKHPEVHFVWAGTGPLYNKIQELIKINCLEKQVHLLGWRKDLPDLMQIFDIYTLVSRWEGLPLALLEAMSAGRSCIASNVSGNPEVIKNNETGLLVPADDIAAFVNAVELLLNDQQLRDKLGKKAISFVKDNFQLNRMISEYDSAYQGVIKNL